MTLEGCVVRIADTIAYIGRDLEDAIRLDLIGRSELPKKSTSCLGSTNGTIVYTLVTDIIKNSMEKDRIDFSEEVFEALRSLKAFNLERIYLNPKIKTQTRRIREIFRYLFLRYLEDLDRENQNSVIYSGFLADMDAEYRQTHRQAEIVRDFIAGMTDRFFLRQSPAHLRLQSQEV